MRAAATAAAVVGHATLRGGLLAQTSRVAIGDLLVRNRAPVNTPLTPEDLLPGQVVIGWPMDPVSRTPRSGTNNRLVLVRLDAARLSAATRDQAASGVMAYSAVCTHEGCAVDYWDDKRDALVCPCHESMFDPYDAGAVLAGPAPRALPRLGLGLEGGNLIVKSLFSATPGSEPV